MKKILSVVMVLAMIGMSAYALEVIEVAADVAQGVEAVEEIAETPGMAANPMTWVVLGVMIAGIAFAIYRARFRQKKEPPGR